MAGPSCAAPTLPIPPPTALVSGPDASGYVTVTGSADPHAYVFVLNDTTSMGVIAFVMPDGTYSIRIAASTGDSIWVWQELGDRASMQNMQTVR